LSFSAYEVTGFFVLPDVLPVDAGVVVFEARPFALAGVAGGSGSAGLADGFTTGSDRLGLFELAKKSDVVVSSSSGDGSRFAFFAAGFLGAAFLGLHTSGLLTPFVQETPT
jgi:hypothetical protein